MRGAERRSEREGMGGGGRKLRAFKPLTLVVLMYFPSGRYVIIKLS